MCTALARWERFTKLSTFPEIGKRVGQLRQVLFSKFLFLSFSQTKCFCGLGPFRSVVALAAMFTGSTVRTRGWFRVAAERFDGQKHPPSTVFLLVPKPLAKAADTQAP